MDITISTNILFYILAVFFTLLIVCLATVVICAISIFRIIKRGVEKIETDIDAVRSKLKNGGMLMSSLLVYLMAFFKKNKKSKKQD